VKNNYRNKKFLTKNRNTKRNYYISKKRKKTNIYENYIINIFSLVVMMVLFVYIKDKLTSEKRIFTQDLTMEAVCALKFPENTLETLRDFSAIHELDFPEVVALYSLENNFFASDIITPSFDNFDNIEEDFFKKYKQIKKSHKANLKIYTEIFGSIINDIKVFPIEENATEYNYIDSWGAPRNYGGERLHKGTDIMDKDNIRGRLKTVSMTSGVIENIGWNELGGYRIGIRSESGNYFYYAHFDTFNENLKKDDYVNAGDFLGFMGDTGYSDSVGEKGKFPVHLHIGIESFFMVSNEQEFWINPYPFLKLVDISDM